MEKHLKKWVLLGALAAVGVIGVLFACDPSRVPVYPPCLFHRLTGLNCPGCGGLRAMHQLLNGNFHAALHLNAMVVLSLPLLAWVGFRFLQQRRKSTPGTPVRPLWLWVYLGAWLVFGVLRELPVPLFAAWSP
ncbi:MAG: DUF2752 domain-containing protein [Akkermansiaceae bacterium]|nr:DUF2752 domain-containing protein [Verrucomicrobiales bacterium]